MLSLAAPNAAQCVQVGHYTTDNENCIPLPDFTVDPGPVPSDAGKTAHLLGSPAGCKLPDICDGSCIEFACNDDRGPTDCRFHRKQRFAKEERRCHCADGHYISPTSGGQSCIEKPSVKFNRELKELKLPQQPEEPASAGAGQCTLFGRSANLPYYGAQQGCQLRGAGGRPNPVPWRFHRIPAHLPSHRWICMGSNGRELSSAP